MSISYDKQSGIVSAWSIAVLQNMNECPKGGIEVLETIGKKIIDSMMSKGGVGESVDDYLEIYDVPEIVYKLAEDDLELQDINQRIKALSPEFQKLLHFIIKGFEPDNVCQTMSYRDQSEYWSKRKECIKIFADDGEKLGGELEILLSKVYEKYTSIRDDFLRTTDILSDQNKKKKSRRKWIITGVLAIIIPLFFFFFIFPKLIQTDFQVLFDYGVEKSGFEMTIDSTDLLNEMILEEELYSPESYWLLALKSLQMGDAEGCKNQLKSLKASDRDLFIEKGQYIYQRLK